MSSQGRIADEGMFREDIGFQADRPPCSEQGIGKRLSPEPVYDKGVVWPAVRIVTAENQGIVRRTPEDVGRRAWLRSGLEGRASFFKGISGDTVTSIPVAADNDGAVG